MVFCGQCGLQLAPGNTSCPRCGSVTEPVLSIDDPHLYDPTIVTSFPAPQTPHSPQPPVSEVQRPPVSPTPPQQRLVLRPDSNAGYHAPTPYDPTSMMTPPVSSPDQRAYDGYPPQSGGTYPTQPAPNAGYQSLPGQFADAEPLPPQRRRGGRIFALLSILIVLLLLLGAMVMVALNPALLKAILGGGPTPTPIVSPTVLSASDSARTVMVEYYNDINAQNYQAAYNLWGNDFQSTHSLSGFEAGYAHTRHDDLTINSLTPLADGTVSTDITIKATEDSSTGTGTVVSIYHGVYIVGQENGVWKLLSGNFQKVG